MITFNEVTAEGEGASLHHVCCSLQEKEVWATIGGQDDGVALFFSLLAGHTRPQQGSIQKSFSIPHTIPSQRAIAWIPLIHRSTEAMSVEKLLELCSLVREEPLQSPAERLAFLGLSSLLKKRADALSPSEMRGVALSEALTSQIVRLILLEEPYLNVEPHAIAALPSALQHYTQRGGCIISSFSCLQQAHRFTDHHLFFQKGLVYVFSPNQETSPAYPVRFQILSSDPSALLSAVLDEPSLTSITRNYSLILLESEDQLAASAAIQRAVLRSHVEVYSLTSEPILSRMKPPSSQQGHAI
ncbi:hypothetical protein [Pajaroellobacter abortibovis]|uniref:ABC transporter domain-containing protein n=1 Tax=Pajaroellobacter abortibovis TaxID=1882918 RepID=A0A1L6MYG9_9BACT|nr:hypothetical protein [Pajaroellobacter abortibovis]APS00497.1 hypothetical protein BCY86_07265 [Pajaroellobacter abortibovis]